MTTQTQQPTNTMTLSDLIDELGTVLAEKDDLAKRERELKDRLIAAYGVGGYDGTLYRATVSHATTSSVAWKAVAMKLNPSRQLIKAYTTLSEAYRVSVKSRPTSRKAA